MRHTISVMVENEFGVLARIAALFSARGYNIESLSVAETEDPAISRMTIVTRGNDAIIEQITKQLNRLINVIKVHDLTGENYLDRELVLVKVSADSKTRSEILNIADIFRGRVVDVGPRSYTIEVTGDEGKVNAAINILRPLGIKEVVRTGKIALARALTVPVDASAEPVRPDISTGTVKLAG